ncbi:hypothetical protein SD72_05215 [Leucobacter komagatae]|uniref:Uncharacterized protein n=1 Tax=Leucobacter komagatae TaxID=55969 RepID=A0A0D0H7M2_9MICO|nr:hypothetical protein SD72_05215 [Leucobacter komagatae]
MVRLVIHESTRPEHSGSGWRMYFTFAILPCAAIGVALAIVVNAVLHSARKKNLLEKTLMVATLSGLSAGLLGAYPLGFFVSSAQIPIGLTAAACWSGVYLAIMFGGFSWWRVHVLGSLRPHDWGRDESRY